MKRALVRVGGGLFGALLAGGLLNLQWVRFTNGPLAWWTAWTGLFVAGFLLFQFVLGWRQSGGARLGTWMGAVLVYGATWRVLMVPVFPDLPPSPFDSANTATLFLASLWAVWCLWAAPRGQFSRRLLVLAAAWIGVTVLPQSAEFRQAQDAWRWEFWGVPAENSRPLFSLNHRIRKGPCWVPTQILEDPETGEPIVVCRRGKVFRLGPGEPKELFSVGKIPPKGEQGLYAIAFPPGFSWRGPENRIFVRYGVSRKGVWNVLSTIQIQPDGQAVEKPIIRFQGKEPIHFGGGLAFGKEGYLYVGFGDNNWPEKLRKNKRDFQSKVLRIDVLSVKEGYRVPEDNPYWDHPYLPPETFATGLRNPFKMAIGEQGQIIVADVGTNLFEEINLLQPGRNYGWPAVEGRIFRDKNGRYPDRGPWTAPSYFYPHNGSRSCIVGGVVYNGSEISDWQGAYLFGDWSGELFVAKISHNEMDSVQLAGRLPGDRKVAAIGMVGGKVWVAAMGGELYRLDARPPETEPTRLLTGTSIFEARCKRCHGVEGVGGDYFDHRIPSFHDPAWQDIRTDEYLAQRIRYGQTHYKYPFVMPPWGAALGEKEIAKLVKAIRSFRREPNAPTKRLSE